MRTTEQPYDPSDEDADLYDEGAELPEEEERLSEAQMSALIVRYEMWGVDKVREELEKPDRDEFADPKVTAFAWEWVAAREKVGRRESRSGGLLIVMGAAVIGAAAAWFLGG